MKSVTIPKCVCCNGRHEDLTVNVLFNPVDNYKYYAICPNTQQPIMIEVVT